MSIPSSRIDLLVDICPLEKKNPVINWSSFLKGWEGSLLLEAIHAQESKVKQDLLNTNSFF